MKNLTEKSKAFLQRNPTKIGTVVGYDFYEHPELGDEHPLICITPDGKKKVTDFFELPDLCDFSIGSIEKSI